MFFKNILKSLLVSVISILVLNLIITILNYISIINLNIINILKYIIPFISVFIGGLYIGKQSINKGWLEGLKLGILFVMILFIINLVFYDYNFKQIILYITVIMGSILGGIIGINKKQREN